MSDVSVHQLVEVCKEAAQAGADVLASEYKSVHEGDKVLEVSVKTSAIDLVTHVDGMTQDVMIQCIQSHFPDHRYIAEEKGAETLGDPDSPYEWIIDPLDGTTNFVHGRKSFGSMIAVQKDKELLAGAIYMPLMDLRFYGGIGEGAYCNDAPVELRKTRDLDDAVLNCNLIHRAKERDGTLYVSLPPCGSIENYGSAAEEIGEILLGHTDGVFFETIPLWDIAPGFVLLKEAGGTIRYEVNPKGGHIAVGCTEPIFDDLWEWCTKKM